MEPKKNPQIDQNRNQGLYFVAALVLVLLLAYAALEWKSYDTLNGYVEALNVPDETLEEIPPLIRLKTPPPPKPPVAPPIIEIAPDDVDIEESEIIATETNQEEPIYQIDDIEVLEDDEPHEIPFTVIEEVPVFPGCENEDDKRACFQKMLQKHIVKNFRYPEPARETGMEGRVNILFTIQTDGSIGEIRMRGPHKILETEARRIIDKLPRMTPGKQRGKAVRVPFSIPIHFQLQ